MCLQIRRRPVGEQNLTAVQRRETRIGWRGLGRGGPARDEDHRLVAPPALTLECHRLGRAGVVQKPRTGDDNRPAARFAKIIHAAPQKLSGVRRIVAQPEPRLPVVSLFRADDFARRFRALRCEQFIVAIIRADHVEQIREAVCVIAAHVRTEQRLRDRARRIIRVKHFDQAGENSICKRGVGRVVDFVAGAVKDDAWMIAVAAHGVGGVNLRPIVEEQMIVVWIFCDRPAVEQLVHHQKTHAVAQIQKLRRGRIVRGADRVHAQLSQFREPLFPNRQRHGCSERAAVVMQANAIEHDFFSVEHEPGVARELCFADAECDGFFIKCFPQSPDTNPGCVQVGMFQIPEPWSPRNFNVHRDINRFPCRHGKQLGFSRASITAIGGGMRWSIDRRHDADLSR